MRKASFPNQSIKFDEFVLDLDAGELRKNDRLTKLQAQPCKVLALLAGRAGQVVTREDIQKELWSEDTFVDFDKGIYYCIKEIRQALGDDAEEPTYVQTVPKKGYRFVAHVEIDSDEPPLREHTTVSEEESSSAGMLPARKTWLWLTAGLIAVGGVTGWLYFSLSESAGSPLRVIPLTGFAGAEQDPAISPDGKHLAFVWNGEDNGIFHLYVNMVGGNEPLQLTEAPFDDYSPAWSPDGRRIAFLREVEKAGEVTSEVLLIPALGGQERRLSTIATEDLSGAGWSPGLAWSPDGRFLALVDRASPEEQPGIFLLSLESGEKKRLTSPPRDTAGKDKQPAFSPDGTTLAFVRMTGFLENEIHLHPLDEKSSKLLVVHQGVILDLDWVEDGSAIVFISAVESEARSSLWMISANGGTPTPLTFGENAETVSVARKGVRLAYDQMSWPNANIWRHRGPRSPAEDPPTLLIASSRADWSQEYAPDGSKVAFSSERSGAVNIWVCESDGTNCFRLTDHKRAVFPRWSRDCKRIAFTSPEGGDPDIFVTDVEGSVTRRLTKESSIDMHGVWSRDGESIFFCSNRGGDFQIWKIPTAGGAPTRLTEKGCVNPRVSEDGRFLYYADRGEKPTIWRIPVAGGKETAVLEGKVSHGSVWALWRDSIIFQNSNDEMTTIERFDLDTREVTQVTSFKSKTAAWGGGWIGFTVSPDGRYILLSRREPKRSDIVLVENFR